MWGNEHRAGKSGGASGSGGPGQSRRIRRGGARQVAEINPPLGVGDPRIVGSQDMTRSEFVQFVVENLNAMWQASFESSGYIYSPAPTILYDEPTAISGCGGVADPQFGPFYCPDNMTVYYPVSFTDRSGQRPWQIGDFALAFILAHEIGHHVQKQLGTLDAGLFTIQEELQADCFAGCGDDRSSRRVPSMKATSERQRRSLQISRTFLARPGIIRTPTAQKRNASTRSSQAMKPAAQEGVNSRKGGDRRWRRSWRSMPERVRIYFAVPRPWSRWGVLQHLHVSAERTTSFNALDETSRRRLPTRGMLPFAHRSSSQPLAPSRRSC